MQQASQVVAVMLCNCLLNLLVLQAGVAECTKLLLLAVEDL